MQQAMAASIAEQQQEGETAPTAAAAAAAADSKGRSRAKGKASAAAAAAAEEAATRGSEAAAAGSEVGLGSVWLVLCMRACVRTAGAAGGSLQLLSFIKPTPQNLRLKTTASNHITSLTSHHITSHHTTSHHTTPHHITPHHTTGPDRLRQRLLPRLPLQRLAGPPQRQQHRHRRGAAPGRARLGRARAGGADRR